MTFSVISKSEAMRKFEKAENKIQAIRIIADLTASSREEIAEFLGVRITKKYPYYEKKQGAKNG